MDLERLVIRLAIIFVLAATSMFVWLFAGAILLWYIPEDSVDTVLVMIEASYIILWIIIGIVYWELRKRT